MRYHSYLEADPTLAEYRLNYSPHDGYGPVFVCPFAVVTGESGRMYQAMRGIQGREKGGTINYGVFDVDDDLDSQGSLRFGYDEVPVFESYRVVEDRDAVSYAGEHYRFDFGPDAYHWYDADERFELHCDRLGQVCTFWVPEQEGYDYPQMLRSHAARATGEIDGDPVEGLFMLDYIYSSPEAMWSEMGMLTKLHNVWLNWLVEYEDGTYEGGYAWRGRPGTDFAAAHHVKDGVSVARSDAEIDLERTERGTISAVDLSLGNEVSVRLEQRGSQDWPLHTCGTVASTSREKSIARSWNYTEYMPLNYGDFVEYRRAYEQLYGRPPSFGQLMKDARIEDNRLVFSE